MSKSLGNFYTIDDILKRQLSPRALRLLFLTSHYRSETNFTWANLEGMQKTWERLLRQVVQLRQADDRTVLSEDKLAKVDEYRQRFETALYDDLDTPTAVTIIWEVIKSNIPSPDKYDLLISFDNYLGLGLAQADKWLAELEQAGPVAVTELPAEIQKLADDRVAARAAQNWAEADRLRQELLTLGYQVVDEAAGQKILQNQANG